VAVTEVLRRVILVEAVDEAQARQRASDAWHNSEVILSAEDFEGAEFDVVGEADGSEDEKNLERIDSKEESEVDKDGNHVS
jgi:hypothetical protein